MRSFKTGITGAACLLFLMGSAEFCSGEAVYSIQVAAATEKSTADETAEQMNRMGHNAFVRLENIPGKGNWYRVYVERFASKAQADKEAASLKLLGLLNDYYVRSLKEQTGSPPPPKEARKEAGTASSGLNFLHVGSFKERGNAEKCVADLQRKGQKAFFVEEGIAGKKWLRIYIGEFADRKEAERAGSLLREKGVISYFKIVGFNKGEPAGKGPKS